jgi:proteic killer suppression protein
VDIFTVILSENAKDDLKKVPTYILKKLESWIDAVSHDGLLAVRKIKGYHDESLKGRRAGQRSIRLNRAYRAIYELRDNGATELVSIEEVNKHDY